MAIEIEFGTGVRRRLSETAAPNAHGANSNGRESGLVIRRLFWVAPT